MEGREEEYEVLRGMTPAKKLAVLRSLIRQAYALKAAGIRALRPDLSEEEVRARTRELVGGEQISRDALDATRERMVDPVKGRPLS